MIYSKVLSEKQLNLIKKMRSLPLGSYLAGGTALALQLGHRTSLDFDFYTDKYFEIERVLAEFQNNFDKVTVEKIAKDSLTAEIEEVSFSLFYYPYKLIKPFTYFEGIKLASIEDILAMKMVAISMRGKRRDFIDTYYLLKKFSLDQIIKITLRKYPSYQPMIILKGLIYFENTKTDDTSRKIEIFDKDFSWKKAKREIHKTVEEYHWKEVAP